MVGVKVKLVAITMSADDGIDKIRVGVLGVLGVVGSNLQLSQALEPEHPMASGLLDTVKKPKLD